MSLDGDIRRLAAIALLAELDPEALRLLAFSAETRTFRAGDVLFRRGEPGDGGFMLTVGSVSLDARPGGGGRQIVGAGALIGERALITAMPRPTTAVALEPCTVLRITRGLFHRVLAEFPDSAARLRRHLARSLHDRLAAEPP